MPFEIIPKRILQKYFPLKKESMNQWTDDVDILNFLLDLCDMDSVITDSKGVSTPINYRDYGYTLFDRGKMDITNFIETLILNSKKNIPAPLSTLEDVQLPDFSSELELGLTAKYVIAFKGIISQILEDGAYSSTSHILESETDLDCILLLASNLFFKQAYQVMRSLLENALLPLYFGLTDEAFDNWRRSDFRTPRIRGKGGMLTTFVQGGLITNEMESEIASLYGNLCKYIHGSARARM